MGQLVSTPDCRKASKNAVSCDGFWPTRQRVGRILQGCLDVRQRLPQDGEYYEHISGISYLVHGKIGSGEYSEVFEASRVNAAGLVERYAIKIYRSRSLDRQKRMKEELRTLTKLGTYCQQIVRLHHYAEEMDDETGLLELKLVLDLCTGGTLRQRMKRGPPLDERAVRILALQLAQALHFLHTRRVIHCDVKPENILFVDPAGLSIRLSDFGVARLSHADGASPPVCTGFNASDLYLAPEILGQEPYGTQVDMWSLGVTLYHCLTGHLPFQNGASLKLGVCQEIVSGSFIRAALSGAQFPEHLSFDALRIIEGLLRIDPNERLNVIEVLNHRWLRGSPAERRPNATRRKQLQASNMPMSKTLSHVPGCSSSLDRVASTAYRRMQTTTTSVGSNKSLASSLSGDWNNANEDVVNENKCGSIPLPPHCGYASSRILSMISHPPRQPRQQQLPVQPGARPPKQRRDPSPSLSAPWNTLSVPTSPADLLVTLPSKKSIPF